MTAREPTPTQRRRSAAVAAGQRTRRRTRAARLDGMVEVLPGVLQPADMAAAEAWKATMRKGRR